jgi:RecB family exonuclease
MSSKEHAWATLLVGRLHSYLHRFHAENGRTIGAESAFRIAVDMDATAGEAPRVLETAEEPAGARVALLSGTVDRVEVYPGGWGEQVPADPDRPEAARVVIVDLKTGRSETRVADAKVADDPQLAAYQLALLEGHLPGAEVRDNAGARLLVLSKTLKNTDYRLARQPPMDADRRAQFLRRIVEVAGGMASDRFDAHLDTHCTKDVFAVCPVHTVKAVSAS